METGALQAGHRVLRLLGSGARSRVWLAEGDRVLKVLTPPVGSGQPVAEVEALHRARGEHVVELLDVSSDDDEVVLVFPRLARGSLADVLAARPGLDAGEAVTALVPVARALARMHAAGVAHGALVAGVILFHSDGAPVLTGFGAAVLFEPGLPEVRRERIEAVTEDRRALAALARGLLLRVTGPRATEAHELAQRLDAWSLEDFEERLVRELFDLAAARPVALDAPEGHLNGERVRIVAVGEPAEAESREPPRKAWLPGFVRGMLESGPYETVRRKARRRWADLSPPRRRMVLAVAAAVVALLVASSLLPAGGQGSPDPVAPVPRPETTAQLGPEPFGAGDDPLAALHELLVRRAECLRMLSVLCLTEVDQDGSSAAVQDRAWLDGVVVAAEQAPVIVATGAEIIERFGDSALIALAPGSDPASVLLMRTEAGWRIRDYLAAGPAP